MAPKSARASHPRARSSRERISLKGRERAIRSAIGSTEIVRIQKLKAAREGEECRARPD